MKLRTGILLGVLALLVVLAATTVTLATILLGQQARRPVSGHVQQRLVGFRVGKPQHRRAALPRAQKLTRPAQLQILAGDFKAVGGVVHHLQPRLGQVPVVGPVDQPVDHAASLEDVNQGVL